MPRDLFVLTLALGSEFKDLLLFRESSRLCREKILASCDMSDLFHENYDRG